MVADLVGPEAWSFTFVEGDIRGSGYLPPGLAGRQPRAARGRLGSRARSIDDPLLKQLHITGFLHMLVAGP